MGVACIRMPREPSAEVRMELVIHRWMDVGSDLFVQHRRALATEQEVVPADRGPAHPERFAASGQALPVCDRERFAADRRLAVTPTPVVAGEAAIVHVPGRD